MALLREALGPQAFVAHALGWALGAFLALGALTAAVDPVGAWGQTWGLGRAAGHPAALAHDRSVRRHQLAHARPECLLLGSSRTRYALKPAWVLRPAGARVLNAGLTSVALPELGAMLRLALQGQAPKVVVVELHPWMACTAPPGHAKAPPALGVSPQALREDALLMTATWEGWGLAGGAAWAWWRGLPPDLGPEGEDLGFLAKRYQEGGNPVFLSGPYDGYSFTDYGEPDPQALGELRRWVALASARGTRLVVHRPPVHRLETERQAKFWGRPAWRRWWREAARILPELWDFNQGNPHRLAPPSKALGPHFIDPTHPGWVQGRWMLARMGLSGPAWVPPGYGARVDLAALRAPRGR